MVSIFNGPRQIKQEKWQHVHRFQPSSLRWSRIYIISSALVHPIYWCLIWGPSLEDLLIRKLCEQLQVQYARNKNVATSEFSFSCCFWALHHATFPVEKEPHQPFSIRINTYTKCLQKNCLKKSSTQYIWSTWNKEVQVILLLQGFLLLM